MKVNLKLAAGMALTLAVGAAFGAAPNWDKVPSKKITLFYPGTAAMEWITMMILEEVSKLNIES